nr:TRAP transporter substrate-binding protein [Pseudomonas sp.]
MLCLAAASDPVFSAEYRLGHVFAVESPVGQAASEFADLVRERSNGEININVFPNSQIGNDEQLVRDVSQGLLEFSFANHGNAVNLDKRLDFGALPLIATHYRQVDTLFYGDGVIPTTAREILGHLNIHVLGWFEQEFRAVSNFRWPVVSLEDLKDLKLRVPAAPSLRTFFENAGVQTVSMPIAELPTALQQRTVDGYDSGPIQTYAARLYENTGYMTLTNHAFSSGAIIMSEQFRKKLTPGQRELVDQVAKEVSARQIQAARAAYQDSIRKLRDEGVKVTELSPQARRRMQLLGMRTWDRVADVYGNERIAALRAEVEHVNQ